MTGPRDVRDVIVTKLSELIAALDRRVPHQERSGETAIARDAAALRKEAVERLDALAGAAVSDPDADAEQKPH